MVLVMSASGLELPGAVAAYLFETARFALLSPSAAFSLASLLSAFLIAAAFLLLRRRRPVTLIRVRAAVRALLPVSWALSRSSRADVVLFFLNTFVFGLIVGQAILSATALGSLTAATLTATFGPMPATSLPWLATASLFTLVLFLAYEFGYWLDHYLAHKIPFLWEFHKVHHSAEVLTPLTNARVHPVDSLVFLNVLGVVMGVTHGILFWAFASPIEQITIAGANALIVVFTYLVAHLHHSHVWIAFTGTLGKILLSPAHHQIHHSTRPEHHDRNFGACLSLWDWLFGTLVIPARHREHLRFGVEPADGDPHSLSATLLSPFARVLDRLSPGRMNSGLGTRPIPR